MNRGDEHARRHREDALPAMTPPRRSFVLGQTLIALVSLALGTGLAASPVKAQDVIAYPAKGQSAEQQNQDRYECHRWAVQQSGFDPTQQTSQAAPPPPPPSAPRGGVLPGAARGAAVGAVGGAIAGDAGKGAAIGAGTGALIGGMRRAQSNSQQMAAQQQYAQAQSSANSAQRSSYNRALAACLQGRGYSVN